MKAVVAPVVIDGRIAAVSVVTALSALIGGSVSCYLAVWFAADLGGVVVMTLGVCLAGLMLANAVLGVAWRGRVVNGAGIEVSTLAAMLPFSNRIRAMDDLPRDEVEELARVCRRRLERGPSFGHLGTPSRWIWTARDEFVEQVSEWASQTSATEGARAP